MTVAVICLALLNAGLIVLLFLREKARESERDADRVERAELLDRIQAPAAAQLAAVHRAIEEHPVADTDEETDETYGYDIRPRDDLALLERIGG